MSPSVSDANDHNVCRVHNALKRDVKQACVGPVLLKKFLHSVQPEFRNILLHNKVLFVFSVNVLKRRIPLVGNRIYAYVEIRHTLCSIFRNVFNRQAVTLHAFFS